MKVSLDWLSDYIKIKIPIEKLISELTLRSVEVDAFYDYETLLDKVVVGQIKKINTHPNADRLKVVWVDIGDAGEKSFTTKERVIEVVCGGSNLHEGDKVAVAMPGARVRWHGDGELVTLKESEIRGVKSFGMICASEELGFMKGKEDEIMILGSVAKVGQPISVELQLKRGVLEIDVLANRGDLLSHVGVAREIAALLDVSYNVESFTLPKVTRNNVKAEVVVKAKELCPRYSALVISGITIGPSPVWLKNRLLASGCRPINAIVDLTNYLMFDLGLPLHAFDYNALSGGKLVVREALEGEVVRTLDCQDRTVPKGALIISDGEKIVDLAGIMGGENSQITEHTSTIVLQAAVFSPDRIRRTSRALGHRTEAVGRYEKGVDEHATLNVLAKAWALIKELCPGAVLEVVIDEVARLRSPEPILFHEEMVKKLVGVSISDKESKKILERLGCEVTPSKNGSFFVTPPSWRHDIQETHDVVEEVARVNGYDKLSREMPKVVLSSLHVSSSRYWEVKVKELLTLQKFHEVINFSFIPERFLTIMKRPFEQHFFVQNPLTPEQSVMRSELLSSLFATISRNARVNQEFQLFEMANVFEKLSTGEKNEYSRMSGVCAGEQFRFQSVRGFVEQLLDTLNITTALFEPFSSIKEKIAWQPASCEETVVLVLDGEVVGTLGRLDLEVARAFDINLPVFWFDVNAEKLFSHAKPVKLFEPIAKFPSVLLDLACVVDLAVPWQEIEKWCRHSGGQWLSFVEPFDVYIGKQVMPGKKSVAFHLEFRSSERTLTMEEAREALDSIVRTLEGELDALVRK